MSKPQRERPVFPYRQNPYKTLKDERGVSPVIAVILMVAITVVLAAVLYVMVSGMLDPPEIVTPGSLQFREDDKTSNKYIGNFQGSVKHDSIEISVFDASSDMTVIMYPDIETSKEISSGLNITIDDVNNDDNLDGSDTIIIYNGDEGDIITIVDKSAGKSVAEYVLK